MGAMGRDVSTANVGRRGSGRRRLAVGVAAVLATAMTAVGGVAAADEPDQAAVRGSAEGAVPGRYLVKLRNTAGTTSDRLVGTYGGTVTHRYRSVFTGYAVTGITEKQARRLAADPAVEYVQRDAVVRVAATQTNAPWGLDRVDQRNLPLDTTYTYSSKAAQVHAYVLDSGIRTTHKEFGGRASSGFDAVDGGTAADCFGHGTHVAGTLGGTTYGIAKRVRLVAVRVLDCAGNGTTAGVIAGIEWVTANARKPAVANMSLGGGVDGAIDDAVRSSIAVGITYILAAGNNDQDACLTSPARTTEAITVGATNRTDRRGTQDGQFYSNFGKCLDIFAPGTDITSASIGGDTDTEVQTGTSMAAPHVAGVAALIIASRPTLTPAQIRDAIVQDATPGKVTDAGSGSPNRLLHYAR
jgi:subtilisin family serine protease